MSCYFRHLEDVFEEAGVQVTSANKKALDAAIHEIVKVDYKDCSRAWKAVKEEIRSDPKRRERFLARVRKLASI